MNNKKPINSKKSMNKNTLLKVTSILVLAIAVLTFVVPQLIKDKKADDTDATKTETASSSKATIDNDGNLIIPLSTVTDTASFYAYNELDNDMEVIAVKASDGTIRTAFNTCQVCNGSGRGYYKEVDGLLVCQNCGNQFGKDDVEVTRGGCNPVPIDESQKQVTDDSIIISKAVLEQNEGIFNNWKN